MTDKMETKTKKIILYTFPPVPHSYTMTPFGLKAEAFLRINNIPYVTCYTTSFGKNRTIPYLRIYEDDEACVDSDASFEEYSDSNAIVSRLLEDLRFDTTPDANLTSEEKAIGHACLRMLEEHTSQTAFHYRYALNMARFCEVTELKERVFSGGEGVSILGNFIYNFFVKQMPKWAMAKSNARGFLGYSSPEILWAMAAEDLNALEMLLSDKVYFFGKSCPSTIDCTVFGHISQILYIPMDFPQQKYLKESCPNVIRFMEHFKEKHFFDWEVLCRKRPNDSLKSGHSRMKQIDSRMKQAALVGTLGILAASALVVKVFSLHASFRQEL
mmetsp:Transcript_15634/g.36034  ORF Transcript_15634/g.36034 Transcript_15634/m.36034 type:complete len:328 (-) Transcript_15634:1310-2293(-)